MKNCPYCAEQIQDSAVKCRYCGEWLNKEPVSPPTDRQLTAKRAPDPSPPAAQPVDVASTSSSAEPRPVDSLVGFGGWLWVFLVASFLPILDFMGRVGNSEYIPPQTIVLLVWSVVGIVVALALIFTNNSFVVWLVRTFIIANIGFLVALIVVYGNQIDVAGEVIPRLIWSSIWLAYFFFSKRVKATYFGAPIAAAPISTENVIETPTSPVVIVNETPSISRPVALPPTVTAPTPAVDRPKVSKIILYGALLAMAAVVVDFAYGFFVGSLTTPVDEWFLRALLFGVYVSFGLVTANLFYKSRGGYSAIAISVALLLALRIGSFLLVTNTNLRDSVKIASDPNLLTTMLTNTSLEIAFIFIPLIVWGWVLKRFEPRLNFTTVANVRRDLKDPEGDKFDDATCGRCGKTTVTAVQGFTGFLGKRERYFCQHCRTFIRGNPLTAMVDGLAAAVVSFALLCGFALTYPRGSTTSGAHSWALLFLFVGVCAGLKMAGVSAYVSLKSYRSST